MIDLSIVRGDVGIYDIALNLPEGVVLAECGLAFMAKRSSQDGDELAVIDKSLDAGITITDANSARLRVEPEDTAELRTPVVLVWDLVLTDAAGDPYTVASGRLVVTSSVRRNK